jgi:hypothetical protein
MVLGGELILDVPKDRCICLRRNPSGCRAGDVVDIKPIDI